MRMAKVKVIAVLAMTCSVVWAAPDNQALKLGQEMQAAVLLFEDTNNIAELIKQGADVNAPIGCGTFSPLDGAVQKHNIEMFKFLLKNGAKPRGHELADVAFSPLSFQSQAVEISKILLATGVSPNTPSRTLLSTPLVAAAYRGNTELVDLLLSQQAIKLDETDADGNTALMEAVRNNHFSIADKLLKAGASVMLTNRWKETALTIAQDEAAKQSVMISELQSVLNKSKLQKD